MSNKHFHKQLSIVLVGAYNTKNFSLLRLIDFGLINRCDEKNSEEYYDGNIRKIELPWCVIVVESEKVIFQMKTTSEQFGDFHLFKDLILSVLNLFITTEVKAIGMNAHYFIQLKDKKEWHKLGNSLIPKQPFLSALSKKEDDLIGTMHLKLQYENFFDISSKNELNIEVRPLFKNEKNLYKPHSILVGFNGHFDVGGDANEGVETITTYIDDIESKYSTFSKNIIKECLENGI